MDNQIINQKICYSHRSKPSIIPACFSQTTLSSHRLITCSILYPQSLILHSPAIFHHSDSILPIGMLTLIFNFTWDQSFKCSIIYQFQITISWITSKHSSTICLLHLHWFGPVIFHIGSWESMIPRSFLIQLGKLSFPCWHNSIIVHKCFWFNNNARWNEKVHYPAELHCDNPDLQSRTNSSLHYLCWPWLEDFLYVT